MKTPIHFLITSGSRSRASALSLSVLIALPALATGAEPEPTSAARTAPAAQPAVTPSPAPTPALSDSSPADPDLTFVVAVFRHGVRSPLEDLNATTPGHPLYSGPPWPPCSEWTGGIPCGTLTPTPPGRGSDWGYLTPHGATAVTLLGGWYGRTYSNAWGKSFKAYLWADVDERTVKTAAALASGFGKSGISVTVGSLPSQNADPLFHPFKIPCGIPDPKTLSKIAGEIKTACETGLVTYKDQLTKLESVLACPNLNCETTAPCQRLGCVEKISCSPMPAPTPTPRPASPIKWDGEFSYASTVTETFLLEYANGMPPGWGNLDVAQLSDLLKLHEFYFQQTERNPYLAGIGSANLVREVLTQLNRKADYQSKLNGKCPHGDGTDDFVGLVGHDTNLANLNTLLKVKWTSTAPRCPRIPATFPTTTPCRPAPLSSNCAERSRIIGSAFNTSPKASG